MVGGKEDNTGLELLFPIVSTWKPEPIPTPLLGGAGGG